MAETEIEFRGMEELQRALEDTVKKAPDIAADALQNAGKAFKSSLIKETHTATFQKTGNLLKSYRLSPVRGYGMNLKIDCYSRAPHFHLIENGHEKVTQKTRKGTELKNGGKNIGFVPGRMMMSAVCEDYKDKWPKKLQEALDKMIEAGGLQ